MDENSYGIVFCENSAVKFCYDYAIPTAISTLCHPFVSARTLMMVILACLFTWMLV